MKPYLFGLLAFTVMLLFSSTATAEIKTLCNTGETAQTIAGCIGALVTPNPNGGGPNRDGNWGLAYPYPTTFSPTLGPCGLKEFTRAWVDTPDTSWLPNAVSAASEWITPYDGENITNTSPAPGWYVYLTGFHAPALLPSGIAPTGVLISGRLSSDNATYGFFLASFAHGGSCAFVQGLPLPINPAGSGVSDFERWWDFSFTSPIPITPDSDIFLYVLVLNFSDIPTGASPTGLRVEFFDTSAFY